MSAQREPPSKTRKEPQSQIPQQPQPCLSLLRRYATIKAPSTGAMGNQFIRIKDTESLEALTARSKDGPLVVFKHSLTCPISSAAYEQMSRYDGEVALIEVQVARQLSKEIESKLGVRHESPQVIVLNKGQVAWSASHFKITAEAVAEAVKTAEGSRQEQ